jgi:sigma-B regulation protein RsbU (phosphoserine phosphatase)
VFVAAVLFFLDFETKTVDIYNCGYSPVFIFAPQEDRKVSCRISRPSLPPLGIEDTLENHSPVSVPMESGLRFVAFSDGLTDMTNPWGERYGEERCQEFLPDPLQASWQSSIPKLVDAGSDPVDRESSLGRRHHPGGPPLQPEGKPPAQNLRHHQAELWPPKPKELDKSGPRSPS